MSTRSRWLSSSSLLSITVALYCLIPPFIAMTPKANGQQQATTEIEDLLLEHLRSGEKLAAVPPIPDEQSWKHLSTAYQMVKANSEDPSDSLLLKTPASNGRGGFQVAFEVKRSEERGRGIYSTALIKKDTEVWNGSFARFREESEWRQFLSYLPPVLARDVVMWAYVTEDEDERHIVGLDLGEGSLVNHGDTVRDENRKDGTHYANLVERSDRLYAARDIQPGEELLCDYHHFFLKDHDLYWFDDIQKELGVLKL